jgi:hypothetical protein
MRVKEYDAPETSMRCLASQDVDETIPRLEARRGKRQS